MGSFCILRKWGLMICIDLGLLKALEVLGSSKKGNWKNKKRVKILEIIWGTLPS